MEITGTVHLNEESNSRHQAIYASLFNDSFIGLYGEFKTNGKFLEALSLMIINYGNKSYRINNATLDSKFAMQSGKFIVPTGTTAKPINCLTLEVDIVAGKDNSQFPINTGNIKLEKNSYFRVLRKGDTGDKIEDADINGNREIQFISTCIDFKNLDEELAYPGKICPRGYSKMIID